LDHDPPGFWRCVGGTHHYLQSTSPRRVMIVIDQLVYHLVDSDEIVNMIIISAMPGNCLSSQHVDRHPKKSFAAPALLQTVTRPNNPTLVGCNQKEVSESYSARGFGPQGRWININDRLHPARDSDFAIRSDSRPVLD